MSKSIHLSRRLRTWHLFGVPPSADICEPWSAAGGDWGGDILPMHNATGNVHPPRCHGIFFMTAFARCSQLLMDGINVAGSNDDSGGDGNRDNDGDDGSNEREGDGDGADD